jgi:hypothetical protein
MKEENISTLDEDEILVWEKPIPTKIPKGKTPIRCVCAYSRMDRETLIWSDDEVIYDKVLFMDTEQLYTIYPYKENQYLWMGRLLFHQMPELKKYRNAGSCGLGKLCFNVFNIEENKWEGFDVRKGIK